MAIRMIRTGEDPLLRGQAAPVKKITPKVIEILEDMAETMLDANGLGLAAPQVGIGKRLVVINITPAAQENQQDQAQDHEDDPSPQLLYLINPRVVDEEGEITALEGCLSFPGLYGEVSRPEKVTVAAQDREGKNIRVTGRGLIARALCHEIDHLNGVLFVDKVKRFVDVEDREEEEAQSP